MMEAPSLTKRTAIAFPIPLVAPVMMAVFPCNLIFWGFLRNEFYPVVV
jgi:hypothetical protein